MVGLLLLGVLASAAILLLLGRKKADMALLRPLEGESGWSHYSKAMELLPRRVEYSGTNLVELAGRLREAEPALEEIRRGLALPNQMPGDPEFVKNLAHSTTLKSLASALVAASRVEADRGNWTNAVERAREAIRFGQEVSRGVVLHALVGVAIEKMGVRQLVSLAGNLEDATLWEVGDWLRETEGRTEPWEKIARREREYMLAAAANWREELAVRLAARKANLPGEVEPRRRASLVEGRLAQVVVALRRFELARGARAERLEDLVPAFLPAIPGDLLAPGPVKAVARDGRLVVYSAAEDGVDNRAGGDDVAMAPGWIFEPASPGR